MRPKTRFARAGDLHIAYQIVGDGPFDLVFVAGQSTHLEASWDYAPLRRFLERLASFSRLILFDRRGTGLSDQVDVMTLEQRVDDLHAVIDAVGSERATLFGHTDGAAASILFAATFPERVVSLVIHGGMARTTAAPGYAVAPPLETVRAAFADNVRVYEDGALDIFEPSAADDPVARAAAARYVRSVGSPATFARFAAMYLTIDVREVLPRLRVPTLVLHRRGDRAVSVRAGRWLAEHIDGARFVELEGDQHFPFAGDIDPLVAEVEAFVTGSVGRSEPDRVLATVMLCDIVASTERANEMGDRAWRNGIEAYQAMVRSQLERFQGVEVKTLGDGFLARFDGPARAIRCAKAIVDGGASLGLPTRAGLHTGECELIGEDVGGIAVHIAFRVTDLAGPGEVLVSRTVRDLVAGSGIGFGDRGTHELKGVPEPWQLYGVTGEPT